MRKQYRKGRGGIRDHKHGTKILKRACRNCGYMTHNYFYCSTCHRTGIPDHDSPRLTDSDLAKVRAYQPSDGLSFNPRGKRKRVVEDLSNWITSVDELFPEKLSLESTDVRD